MKGLTRVALLLMVFTGSHAAELSTIETDDLRLLYFDPSETYLTPYVVRSFTNSIDHQRRVFDYEPSENISVLLTDFADWGNAGAIAGTEKRVARRHRTDAFYVRDQRHGRAHVFADES